MCGGARSPLWKGLGSQSRHVTNIFFPAKGRILFRQTSYIWLSGSSVVIIMYFNALMRSISYLSLILVIKSTFRIKNLTEGSIAGICTQGFVRMMRHTKKRAVCNIEVFWDIMLFCWNCSSWHFEGPCYLKVQGRIFKETICPSDVWLNTRALTARSWNAGRTIFRNGWSYKSYHIALQPRRPES